MLWCHDLRHLDLYYDIIHSHLHLSYDITHSHLDLSYVQSEVPAIQMELSVAMSEAELGAPQLDPQDFVVHVSDLITHHVSPLYIPAATR